MAEKLPLLCRDAFDSTREISALSALLSWRNLSSNVACDMLATVVGAGTARSTMRSTTRSRMGNTCVTGDGDRFEVLGVRVGTGVVGEGVVEYVEGVGAGATLAGGVVTAKSFVFVVPPVKPRAQDMALETHKLFGNEAKNFWTEPNSRLKKSRMKPGCSVVEVSVVATAARYEDGSVDVYANEGARSLWMRSIACPASTRASSKNLAAGSATKVAPTTNIGATTNDENTLTKKCSMYRPLVFVVRSI